MTLYMESASARIESQASAGVIWDLELSEGRIYIHGEAHNKGPEASHLVTLDGLPDSLAVLGVFALESIAHQVLVDENLGVESIFLLELLDFDIAVLWLDPGRRHLAVCVNGIRVLIVC